MAHMGRRGISIAVRWTAHCPHTNTDTKADTNTDTTTLTNIDIYKYRNKKTSTHGSERYQYRNTLDCTFALYK